MITGKQLSLLPNEPGVYLMKDAKGEIVYVGKAIDIQKRVRSHCRRKDGQYASSFVENVFNVDTIVTDNEVEALLLEYNLIKKHNPSCNVKLKDDKRYPYIKVTTQEAFPRAYITRTVEADGAQYFGPYPHATLARRMLSALHEIFRLRTCKYDSEKLLTVRPCLDYEMNRCCAPCGAVIPKDEYAALCQELVDFLRGKHQAVLQTIDSRMRECSEQTAFEKAAFYRDILEAGKQHIERQKMFHHTVENQDFAGFARVHDIACTAVIRRRNGRVVGTSRHFLDDVTQADTQEILNAFLIQFYARNTDIPKEIFLPSTIGKERIQSLEKALSLMTETAIAIKIPQRGAKHAMLQLAEKNAAHYAEQQYRKLHGVTRGIAPAVIALQESLKLEVLPLRVEGYDISNTQGGEAVGAMVVFQDGKPQKSAYRRFKIKGVDGIDDYAMMQEMLRRRFQHGEENAEEKKRFAEPPDLIVIDGGKGHLHAAMETLDEQDIKHFPICSLAKQEELIFLPGIMNPIRLSRRHPGLRLLQQIRDEAHRFGIGYHRKLRGKRIKKTSLCEIQGIGPAKERTLIRRFGSIEAIRSTTEDELTALPGITAELARRIHTHLS